MIRHEFHKPQRLQFSSRRHGPNWVDPILFHLTTVLWAQAVGWVPAIWLLTPIWLKNAITNLHVLCLSCLLDMGDMGTHYLEYQKIVKRRDHFSGYLVYVELSAVPRIRHKLLYLPVVFFKLKSRRKREKGVLFQVTQVPDKNPGSTYPSGQPWCKNRCKIVGEGVGGSGREVNAALSQRCDFWRGIDRLICCEAWIGFGES